MAMNNQPLLPFFLLCITDTDPSFLLILLNSTRPAAAGMSSLAAKFIRRQSSYEWSVTGTPRALKAGTPTHTHTLELTIYRTTRKARLTISSTVGTH